MKILVFEELPLLRDGLHRLLSAQPDMEVVAATDDMNEAIIQAKSRSFDTILVGTAELDPSIEMIRGVTERAEGANGAPHCIAFYQELTNQVVAGLLRAGAKGLLNRDANGDEVVAAARGVAGGRTVVTPEVAHHLAEWFREHADASHVHGLPEVRVLTGRECEVLSLIGHGLSTDELAGALFISVSTVRTHLHHIQHKLDLHNRAQLVAFAFKSGLVHANGHIKSIVNAASSRTKHNVDAAVQHDSAV